MGIGPFRPADRAETSRYRGAATSVAVHVAVLLVALGALNRAPRIEPYRLPGTANGVRMLAYYAPGSPAQARSDVSTKKVAAGKSIVIANAAVSASKPVAMQAPSAETGSGSASLSGIGEGEIRIALEKYFPYPKPDLSTLPHGTRGDVILDAVVDQDGKISVLTVVQGLGPAIDDVVIATVKQWSYIPATKDGVPVPSKQELHFHYERS
jgi:periplasmic protein TonB